MDTETLRKNITEIEQRLKGYMDESTDKLSVEIQQLMKDLEAKKAELKTKLHQD